MNVINTLRHYGVSGMKWGTRGARSNTSSSDHRTASSIRKKKLREMSNDEIKTIATRIRLEKDYKSLNPSTVARGAKAIDTILSSIGKVAAAATTITAMSAGIKKVLEYAAKHKG